MRNAAVGREARKLAELYSFEAYSGGTLPRNQVQTLRGLWQVMQSEQTARDASVAE
jgi:hypothetical protein